MQPLSCDLWLMEQRALHHWLSSLVRVDPETAKAAAEVRPRTQKAQKLVGIIPIHGALEARPSARGEFFGMASYERIGQVFDAMMADEKVGGIVLDVMSPGGMVYGAQELAAKIYAARGPKPIVAVSNPLMASGALWIASAADRIIATPSSDTGSVGVILERVNVSKQLEKFGITVEFIRSSKSPHKVENNDVEELSDEGRKHLQGRVDEIYAQFVGDLAKHRGVTVEHVNEHFGKGRVLNAKAARAAGMVDKIGTLDEIVTRIAEGRYRRGSEAAEDIWDAPTVQQMAAVRAGEIMERN